MSKILFSDNVKKWSHIWTPREDCNSNEISYINKIFRTETLKWDEDRRVFTLEYLHINNSFLYRLTFLPPLIINTTFGCSYNKLKSLEGGPIEAVGYLCSHNNLKDLHGAPEKCIYFDCRNNPLEDFKVYAEQYEEYYTPNDSKLIFLDSNIWNNEEYDNNRDNIDISECYL